MIYNRYLISLAKNLLPKLLDSLTPWPLRARTALITVLALSSLSACDDIDLDKLAQMTDENDPATSTAYCQSHPVPFAHSLCSVAQNSLTEAGSPLSLQLFWRPTPAPAASADVATNMATNAATEVEAPKPLYTFTALLADLPKHSKLKFATNAGMYNSEFAPIGYTVMQGKEVLSLNINTGAGNFHLMPNGVLWWNKAGNVHITETQKFQSMLADGAAKPWFATQSGPMLVIDGKIHPKFVPDSASKKFRNGVGVCDDGNIKFVNSQEPVNFYQFASLFKTELKCPNALFLDGGIASALYAPDIGIDDAKNMGVMVGLVEND